MSQISKLYAWVTANPRASIAFADLERLLVAFGFTLDRTNGSHRQYVHPLVTRSFPIQPSGKNAKVYQVRQFLDMIEEYGLSVDP